MTLKEGIKYDMGKTRLDLISPYFLEEVGKVLTYGAEKYEEHNWLKGIKYSRCFSAALRHLWAWYRGEINDPETGLNHLAHATCCIMFLLHYEMAPKSYKQFDDKPKF